MNIELLRQVQERILSEPRTFDMDRWVTKDESCGTGGCIAGWAIAISHRISDAKGIMRVLFPEGGASSTCPKPARDALGLTRDEGHRLFNADTWPSQFRTPYYNLSRDFGARAEVASARIEFFIATNGTDVMPEPAVVPEVVAETVKVLA